MLLEFVAAVRRHTGLGQLCLGGSLFYNSAINAALRLRSGFAITHVAVNPGDAGTALGEGDPLRQVDAAMRLPESRLRTELCENLPPVIGNRIQLQQVLLNLIVNAMDAMSNTPEDNRTVRIRTRLDLDGCVAVTVADCGSGVPSIHLPRVFESFFTTRAEGMGLGLSIARSIVEAHRGRIWAANNESGGATFHFIIPAAQRQTIAATQSI